MTRMLIIIGVMFILLGLLWPIIKKFNLGHLPGDIIIQREGFSFYFPIVTCIVISIIISAIVWLFKKM